MLLKFVKKHAPSAMDIDEPEPEPVAVVAPPKPKKNKPMSKYEQEARINSIEGTISRFQGGGGGGRGSYSSQPSMLPFDIGVLVLLSPKYTN